MKGKIKRDTCGLVVQIPDTLAHTLGLKIGDEVNIQFNLNSDTPAPKEGSKKDRLKFRSDDSDIKGSLYGVDYLRDKNDKTVHYARIISGLHTGNDMTDRKLVTDTLKYIEGSKVVLLDYKYIKDIKKSPLEVRSSDEDNKI